MYSQGIIAGWYYIGCTVLSLSLFSLISFPFRFAIFIPKQERGISRIQRYKSDSSVRVENRVWIPRLFFLVSCFLAGVQDFGALARISTRRVLRRFDFVSITRSILFLLDVFCAQITISSNVSLLRFSSSLWNDFWLKLIIYRVTLWNLGLGWIWGKNIWEWNWYSLRK